jgi:hypothetical protein
MWQRNECGLRKLPSAAVSYSSAGPALGTSGRGQNGENRTDHMSECSRMMVSDGSARFSSFASHQPIFDDQRQACDSPTLGSLDGRHSGFWNRAARLFAQ